MPIPELGKKAPSFKGVIDDNETLSLKDLLGQYIVLFFYPKDNTPGCTKEAQAFNENLDKFEALNAVVIGVSRDSLKSHDKFKSKYELAFDLISDEDEKICKAYDVIKMKNMYGKQVRGIERSTFLIDPEGKIASIWRKVKVEQHVEIVLQTLEEIQQ